MPHPTPVDNLGKQEVRFQWELLPIEPAQFGARANSVAMRLSKVVR